MFFKKRARARDCSMVFKWLLPRSGHRVIDIWDGKEKNSGRWTYHSLPTISQPSAFVTIINTRAPSSKANNTRRPYHKSWIWMINREGDILCCKFMMIRPSLKNQRCSSWRCWPLVMRLFLSSAATGDSCPIKGANIYAHPRSYWLWRQISL